MDNQLIKDTIVRHARAYNVSIPEAGNQIIRGLGTAAGIVDSAVAELLAEAARNQILDNPRGAYRRDEAKQSHWYSGPVSGDIHWPAYLATLNEVDKLVIAVRLESCIRIL